MRAAAPGPRTGDAAPAPSECLSEARYRLPRHAAVSFGSSDISGLFFASTVSPVADGGALVQRPRGRWFPKEGRPGARADSAPGESFSVAHCRLLHHTAVSFVSSDISVFRGRDDEYYRRKWLRKAADPSSAPQNGPATPPHGGGGART
jgi:hypothetical protein